MESIDCVCGKEMDFVSEELTKIENRKKINHKCKCGNTALCLFVEGKPMDVFIKDPKGNILKHKTIDVEED